jgi:hypothetical protein
MPPGIQRILWPSEDRNQVPTVLGELTPQEIGLEIVDWSISSDSLKRSAGTGIDSVRLLISQFRRLDSEYEIGVFVGPIRALSSPGTLERFDVKVGNGCEILSTRHELVAHS